MADQKRSKLKACGCCGAEISKRAQACPHCGDAPRGFHFKLAWIVTWLLSILSLLTVFWASFAESLSAPQQCAVIAGAIGFTIIPYCYARAVEKFEGL